MTNKLNPDDDLEQLLGELVDYVAVGIGNTSLKETAKAIRTKYISREEAVYNAKKVLIDDDLIDEIIANGLLADYIYAKARFDNAHDTNTLLVAADENSRTLQKLLRYRLAEHCEQILIERIDKTLQEGKTVVKIGNKCFLVTEEVSDAK